MDIIGGMTGMGEVGKGLESLALLTLYRRGRLPRVE